MNCRKIIKGVRNYDINELKYILENYVYNKYDNIFNGVPVYKILDIELLPGEIFEKYPKNVNIAYWTFRNYLKNSDDNIEVSNLGRIKINNIIQRQEEIKYGYLFVNINNKPYYVYRLVGEIFCSCPVEETNKDWHVHHITNNGYDNRANNLIWVNSDEHKFIESCYNPKKKINEIKESLYIKLENIISQNNCSENIIDIFRDIVLIGNIFDKKRIENIIPKMNIDLSEVNNLLLNNINIKYKKNTNGT